jgi:hypothetical protein
MAKDKNNFELAMEAYKAKLSDYLADPIKNRQDLFNTLKPLSTAIKELDLSDPENLYKLASFKVKQTELKSDCESNIAKNPNLPIPEGMKESKEMECIKIISKLLEIIEGKKKVLSPQHLSQYGQLPTGQKLQQDNIYGGIPGEMKPDPTKRALPIPPEEKAPPTQYQPVPRSMADAAAKPTRPLPTPPKKNITPTQYQPVPRSMADAAKNSKGGPSSSR